MIDESLLGYLPFNDPSHSQAYINAMNAMKPIDGSVYNMQYHHSIIDDDSVNDSIKVRVLYNELMQLKSELSNTDRKLMGEINLVKAEIKLVKADNKRLSDEIASIKQALYFG